jgi:hypothetical protein
MNIDTDKTTALCFKTKEVKLGNGAWGWQCQLHSSHWKYKSMQKAKKDEQSGSQPKSVPIGSGMMPISGSYQGQSRQSTSVEIEKTKEREVDMIDAV